MPQHDYFIDNSTGANVRADINSVLEAIRTNNSGSSAPSTNFALQTFADTTNDMLKLRNEANNAFVNLRKFDGSLPLPDGSESSPSLFFDDDTNTGLYSSAADTLNITTGGSTAVTVNSSQKVGIGTTSPSETVDISGTMRVNSASNISMDSSASGQLKVRGDAYTGAIALDATAMHIYHDSASRNMIFGVNETAALTIDSSGAVIIGGTTTNARLHVKESANLTESNPHVQIQGSGYALIMFLDGSAAHIGQNSNSKSLRFYSGATESAGAQLSAGGTSFTTYSDERLKKNIKDIGSVLDKIKDIRCVTYLRKDIENFKETIGFVAQDFVNKFDQVLDSSKLKDTDEEESLGIKYTETIPILLKAIQELSAKVEALEAA